VRRLEEIAGGKSKPWNEVASLIAPRQCRSYDQPVNVLRRMKKAGL
jgi:hypothetical protein